MPLILGTNSIKDEGYKVDNSLRFDDASSDYLNRTPSSVGNQKTFTISFWYKRTNFGANDIIISTSNGSSGFFNVGFIGSGTHADKFFFYYFNGSSDLGYTTNRLFRDVEAWYHIVLAIDTTQGTESNREKLYINGVEETTVATYDAFTQNLDTYFNDDNVHYIGYDLNASSVSLNGYLAEVVNIDGLQLDATSFGEFDEDTGIWKPKDVSGLTFGTNGFYLDFENSGSLGADVSGQGNNFTVNNLTSIDQTTDTCTNNFATLNPLVGLGSLTLSNGNLTCGNTTTAWDTIPSTIGASSGKWYSEYKWDSTSGGFIMNGIISIDTTIDNINSDFYIGQFSTGYGYYSANGSLYNNGSASAYGNSYTVGDIIGIAMDLDNSKLYFSKNGTWQNSGDPTSGATGTGAISITSGLTYAFGASNRNSAVQSINYGNPPYSISSGNSDANGYGNFEYSVPSGYYALNTKNLAEYG